MKLLLADDHVLFREALVLFIDTKCPDWQVSTASDIFGTLKLLQEDKNPFDLVLLDLRMPGMHGLEGLQKIIELLPRQKVAILSGVAENHHVQKAMKIGAKAYFPKTLSGKALIKAIDLVVHSDHRFIPTDEAGLHIMPSYYDDSSHKSAAETQDIADLKEDFLSNLTKREKEVLYLLSQGLSNKEIANHLDLKPATIKVYVTKICKKLDVKSRTQAALICQQYDLLGVLTIPPEK